jgi:hypothetical protein
MLEELEEQIKKIKEGSTINLPINYGHAIAMIAQIGQANAEMEEPDEVQISAMRAKAEHYVSQYGPEFLRHMSPLLRALVLPEDLSY